MDAQSRYTKVKKDKIEEELNISDTDNAIVYVDENQELTFELSGLIANKLLSQYNRPVILLRHFKSGKIDELRGSARGKAVDGLDNLKDAITLLKPDIVVDFTQPNSAFSNAKTILEAGARPVIGTTGLKDNEISDIAFNSLEILNSRNFNNQKKDKTSAPDNDIKIKDNNTDYIYNDDNNSGLQIDKKDKPHKKIKFFGVLN